MPNLHFLYILLCMRTLKGRPSQCPDSLLNCAYPQRGFTADRFLAAIRAVHHLGVILSAPLGIPAAPTTSGPSAQSPEPQPCAGEGSVLEATGELQDGDERKGEEAVGEEEDAEAGEEEGGEEEGEEEEEEDEGDPDEGCLVLLPLCHRPLPSLHGTGCKVQRLPNGDVAVTTACAMGPGT